MGCIDTHYKQVFDRLHMPQNGGIDQESSTVVVVPVVFVDQLSQEIVRRAPLNTRSASADIAGIEKILIARR